MRVFVAGATGVIGRPLIERLLAASHEVTALTRSPERAASLRARGVDGVVGDAYDVDGVHAAVAAARPEVVVNQLTDLPAALDPRKYKAALAGTNHLRREASSTLASAARAAGARRLIGQSVAFMLPPHGPRVVDEDAPLWTGAPEPIRSSVEAILALERATTQTVGVEGVVLRYGWLYGPGTAYAPDGHSAGEVAKRRFPVVGAGTGLFSFVHVNDAADATVLALDRGQPGALHVTDDEPVAQRDWVPAMAAAMGAKPPRHAPRWLATLVVGPLVLALTDGEGASNARAREQLGWQPTFPTYREGFPAVFG